MSWEACFLFLKGNAKPFLYKSEFTHLRSLYLYFGETGNHVNSPRSKASDSDKRDKPEIRYSLLVIFQSKLILNNKKE